MVAPAFPCTKCGACCRRLGFDEEGNVRAGRCVHLTDENLCAIYDERPEVCRIDRLYEVLFSHLEPGEYVQMTAAVCNHWQEEDHMPESLRVVV